MLKVRVWPHGPSEGARVLAEAINRYSIEHYEPRNRIDVIKLASVPSRSSYNYKFGDIIINYGNASMDRRNFQGRWTIHFKDLINDPSWVQTYSNKSSAMIMLKENLPRSQVLPTTTLQRRAESWLRDGVDVVERHILRGHSGDGIRIVSNRHNELPSNLIEAPLYSKYLNKRREFRVHVIKINNNNYTFHIQQKKRRIETNNPNWRVRNLENGFIYASEEVDENVDRHALFDLAKKAITGLDFGAVDILETNDSLYNNQLGYNGGELIVLEVNTAPGISATSVKHFYGEGMVNLIHKRRRQTV